VRSTSRHENYWKRSNYFWLFQAASITLTGVIYSHDPDDPLLLLSSGLGVITAQVGWLTARGSKFWQSNWESHVDFLEEALEGKLTQVILYEKDEIRSSVSRVNERLYGALLIAWVLVFANHALMLAFGPVINPSPQIVGLGSMLLLAGALLFVSIGTRGTGRSIHWRISAQRKYHTELFKLDRMFQTECRISGALT
jgi:hypothetical protein